MQETEKNNVILPGSWGASIEGVDIEFKGRNNILFVEEGARFYPGSNLTFLGNNNVMYFSADKFAYKVKINVGSGSTVYFGKDNYFNGFLNAVVSEGRNLLVGGGGVFSFGLWIRTADVHLIYSLETKERINNSASVMIGDHVWLGQNALLLKGTNVGSGSVIAGGSVLSGQTVESNTVYGGNPAKKLRENIFFLGDSSHNYTDADTERMRIHEGEEFRYHATADSESLLYDRMLLQQATAEEKLALLKEKIADHPTHDRFAISQETILAAKEKQAVASDERKGRNLWGRIKK